MSQKIYRMNRKKGWTNVEMNQYGTFRQHIRGRRYLIHNVKFKKNKVVKVKFYPKT